MAKTYADPAVYDERVTPKALDRMLAANSDTNSTEYIPLKNMREAISDGLNESVAIAELRMHDPSLNFAGFVKPGDPIPSYGNRNAWKVTVTGTVFGLSNVPRGAWVVSSDTSFSVQQPLAIKNKNSHFPYASPELINTPELVEASKAIKELYITDYDDTFDYILQVFRRNQLVASTYYYEIRVIKVTAGTTSVLKTYRFNISSPNTIDYNEGVGDQLVYLDGGAYILLDWKEVKEGTGYGALSRGFLCSNLIGSENHNKSINNYLNNYTKNEVDKKIWSKDVTLLDASDYIQNGSYTSQGTFSSVASYRSIVNYPVVAGQCFKILGITNGSKNGFFFDSLGDQISSKFSVVNGIEFRIPPGAETIGVTLVSAEDSLIDYNLRFYKSKNDSVEDFTLKKINDFNLSGSRILPENINILDVTAYIQNAAYNSEGAINLVSSYRSIVNYPVIAGQCFKVLGITNGSKNGFFFDSLGNQISDKFSVVNGTKIIVPPGAETIGVTLVSAEDSLIDYNLRFYKSKNDSVEDFKTIDVGGYDLAEPSYDPIENVYSKSESDTNFAAKSITETQLSNHETRISSNEGGLDTVDSDNQLIKGKLDQLIADPPTNGAVTGNNSWSGVNSFLQPIKSVAAQNDDEVIRQGEYKQTLNRFENAADYGFDPANTANQNTTALNNALSGGNKTLIVSKPGEYLMDNTAYLDDNTKVIFGSGVVLKKAASFMAVLMNRGALTRSTNFNIYLYGLKISTNGFDYVPVIANPLYGLRGHASFLHVKNLFIYDFKCLDINSGQWGLHVCTYDNFILDTFEVRGNKDGIHLGRGKNFIVRNGVCETYDDAVALNAHDYANANPEIGNIENGLIENIVDVDQVNTTGYFTRILLGAWVDWYLNMPIMNGDAVVNNGRVYRAIGTQSTNFTSQTEPISTSFSESVADAGGFIWKLVQNDAVYSANVFNIEYRRIQGHKARTFVQFSVDRSGSYNRSLHPDVLASDYPYCKKLLLKDCYLPGASQVIGASTSYDIEIDNLHGQSSEIVLETVDINTGISNVTIRNSDFTKVIGNGIAIGSNVYAKIRDCKHNGSLPITCSGRLDCNENIATFLSIAPQKGDAVKVAYVPYIYNGSSWINLI